MKQVVCHHKFHPGVSAVNNELEKRDIELQTVTRTIGVLKDFTHIIPQSQYS